jgi:exodeoxyribonuclease VII large subunit
MWAFNEEIVADAVFTSVIPVLAGIGHEVDSSMADMTADVRAATPSHAAQILWPLRSELAQRVDDLEIVLQRAYARCVETAAMRLQAVKQALHWLSPVKALGRKYEAAAQAHAGLQRAMARLCERRERLLEQCGLRLRAQAGNMLHTPERALEQCAATLRALDPHAPLERGYALAYDGRGRLLRSVSDAKKGDSLRLRLRDGALDASVTGIREKTA